MYKVIKRLRRKKELKAKKCDGKILNIAIILFISFSALNIFLILNFMNLLNSIATI